MTLVSVDTHNQGGFLFDAPADHEEFQSMIVDLRACPLAYALSTSSIIYKELIVAFWTNACFVKDDMIVVSTVQGTNVVISEAIIREVLQINDKSSYPTKFSVAEIRQALVHMHHEGQFPP